MNAPPPVTLAVPVYNGENFLAGALTAIQAQEYTDFRVLIRDNASTDSTEEVAREFVRNDDRFRFVRNDRNIGGARNSNALLADVESPLVAWAYHDDLMHPRFLLDSVNTLDRSGQGAVVAFPRVVLIDETGDVVGRHDDADLAIEHATPHERLAVLLGRVAGQVQFGLMRTEAVRSSGGVSVSTGGEMVLPAALSLRGALALSSSEPRLSARQHAERSGGDRESEAAWVNPDRPHIPFPYSRSTPLLLRAVGDAPLSASERRKCLAVVLWYWTRPGWRSIAGDVARLPWDLGWLGRR